MLSPCIMLPGSRGGRVQFIELGMGCQGHQSVHSETTFTKLKLAHTQVNANETFAEHLLEALWARQMLSSAPPGADQPKEQPVSYSCHLHFAMRIYFYKSDLSPIVLKLLMKLVSVKMGERCLIVAGRTNPADENNGAVFCCRIMHWKCGSCPLQRQETILHTKKLANNITMGQPLVCGYQNVRIMFENASIGNSRFHMDFFD